MTNLLRSVAALCVAPIILACALVSAGPAPQALRGAMTGPTMVAAALSEITCADSADPDACLVATEDARCLAEGWCR